MIQRIRNYTKAAPQRDARKLFIICEGNETEPNYFNFFKSLSSNLAIITIPSENGETDPIKLMEYAEQNLLKHVRSENPDYLQNDQVWFVIDTDDWQQQGKIEILREFCAQTNAQLVSQYDEHPKYAMWNVAQSNPQFELWHYYHVYNELPKLEDVEQYVSFKEYVNDKISGGFNVAIHSVYMSEAIVNAEQHFQRDKQGYPILFSTEVYLLCQEILPFVKRDLEKLKSKLSL